MREIESWLTLKSVPGIGNVLFLRLIRYFGSPDAALKGSQKELQRVVPPNLASTIARYRPPGWIAKEIEEAVQKGYRIISLEDRSYPELLRHISDPPPILYLYGNIEAMACPISVVGSRNASTYGRTVTHHLCTQLVRRGATVISGMAKGIDTAAHQGALAGGGRTVAVLGSGLNRPYPLENLKLFHQIAENGCVVTEFPLSAEPEPHHFPKRNRIISGMSLGTVVAEAARKSGSLITARLALEQNREVFAVPGSIHAATAKGTHDLIKQGAKLVEHADDILEEIAPQLMVDHLPSKDAKQRRTMTEQESVVYAAMEMYPLHIDVLAERIDMEMGLLMSLLFQLELKGYIHQEPGKYFVCSQDAAGG